MKLANNIAAFTNVLGLDDLGVIWGLANVDWPSDQDRDEFIQAVSNLTVEDING